MKSLNLMNLVLLPRLHIYRSSLRSLANVSNEHHSWKTGFHIP